jgi:small subunit ribosomal protein S20
MAGPESKKNKSEPKKKRPSALKRDLQNEKQRLANRSFRSSVLTAVRILDKALAQKESEEDVKTKLQHIYSLMDKGVKKGVFKANKASRTKSRICARIAKV